MLEVNLAIVNRFPCFDNTYFFNEKQVSNKKIIMYHKGVRLKVLRLAGNEIMILVENSKKSNFLLSHELL